jgi:hypothetical protein
MTGLPHLWTKDKIGKNTCIFFFIFQIVVLALLGKASCPKIQPFLKVLKHCTTLSAEEGPSRKYYSALGTIKIKRCRAKILAKVLRTAKSGLIFQEKVTYINCFFFGCDKC